MPPALHHVALATRDLEATHHFYSDVLGLRLLHTETSTRKDGAWLKHVFYDLGDGSCLAFFDLHGVGEPPEFDTAISTGLGLPPWVNHLALRADPERVADVRRRLEEAGIPVAMDLDHDWCRSVYVTDPNGVLVEFCVDTPGLPVDPEEAERLLHVTPAGAAPVATSAPTSGPA